MTKQRKENTAAMVIDKPPINTVHNYHRPGLTGPIAASFIFLVISLVGLWHFIVGLVDKMGFREPEAAIGWGLVWLIGFCTILYVAGRVIGGIVGMVLESWERAKEREHEAKLQMLRYQLQLTQAVPIGSGRSLEGDARKGRIIQAVMGRAFAWYEQRGLYRPNDQRPWSRRGAEGIEVDGKAITTTEADKVRGWLTDAEMIDGDQINVALFPDMNVVNRWLRRNFEPPIVYGSRGSLPSLDDGDSGGSYLPTGWE